MKRQFIFLPLTLTLFSCQTQQKFDKTKWAEVADLKTFPNRKYMIDDLVNNYQLKGKKYSEIVKLLDKPQSKLDSTMEIYYDIDIAYGTDIDPIYSKTLSITFDKDTVVKSFEVEVWRK
jgi:hypothetical protein